MTTVRNIKKRRISRAVKVGRLTIGGGAPIVVQSMCNVKTSKIASVVKQIHMLERAGCELIRVSVLDDKDAAAIKRIKKETRISLCADIHFSASLALAALQAGIHKIRLNPGNITSVKDRQKVIAVAKEKNVPIRIGVNSGSVEPSMQKSSRTLAQQMAYSCLKMLDDVYRMKYKNIVISLKAHDVNTTIEANNILAQETDCPIHLGVTASGRGEYSIIKTSVALGSLLSSGIGDTIRVSLTDDPCREVMVGYEILQALKLRKRAWEVIACPTCGRSEIDIIELTKEVESLLETGKVKLPRKPYQIAVMGCVVNGPGESKHADVGITGGRGFGFIFKKGKLVRKVKEKELMRELVKEIQKR